MYTYGQYCPVAKATEIVGDRWTLLILRDMLTGTRHFNDLERGLAWDLRAGLPVEQPRRPNVPGVVEKILPTASRQRHTVPVHRAGK